MQEIIFNFGLERIQNIEIKNARLIFNLGDIQDLNETELIDFAMQKILQLNNINLFDYEQKIIQRENKLGFYLNWHIDDCAIFKHKDTDNKKNNIKLNDKFSLFNLEELPKYTMIIYLSSCDKDFFGGEFEFVNKKIKPQKYDVIFFDSREVHRVNTFRKGERKNILVKFYEKK